MTRIKDVPEGLLEQPPTPSEELEQLRKELEELHYNRRSFVGIGQEMVYRDDGISIDTPIVFGEVTIPTEDE